MSSNNIPGKEDAVAGDILCAKMDGSKMIFKTTDYADISGSGWTPIGVVVIPPSHDVYGTGEGAAVSLKHMSYSTPDEGSTSTEVMHWGQYEVDTSLTNFNRVNATNNAANPTISVSSSYCFLPSDKFSDTVCNTDRNAYYVYHSTAYVPSPYLLDGSRNEDYYTTEYTEYNALSDFDGKRNTNVICSLATAQSDWRTASTITNNYTSGYSPAACCCWRYHTVGTNRGDWYLPAMGELGYLMVRFKTINNSISNVSGATVDYSGSIISSSEYSNTLVRDMLLEDGDVGAGGKYDHHRVRSFIRF